MPGPGGRRYPAKPPSAAAKSRRTLYAIIGGVVGVVALAAAAAFVFVFDDEDGPVLTATEQTQVREFSGRLLALEAEREAIAEDYEDMATNISFKQVSDVYQQVEPLAPRQRELADRMRGLSTPNTRLAIAHTLFIDAYEAEADAYDQLLSTFGQTTIGAMTVRFAENLGHTPGYLAATRKIERAEESRQKAYEELDRLLRAIGLSVEELRLPSG